MLRIGQEALTNAIRHADAAGVRVELTYTAEAVTLRVADDGRGFDRDAWQDSTDGHYGLRTMAERATELGAELSVMSTIGQGTVISVAAPRRPRRAGTVAPQALRPPTSPLYD